MCNKEQLVGYLYGDLSAADRAAFESHAAGCAGCREEVAQLGETRQHLSSWAPPEPEFDVRVVREPAPVVSRRFGFVPIWGLAAAAALLVTAGAAALANLEVRVGPEGVVVRTGWASPPVARASTTPPPTAEPELASPALAQQLAGELRVLEARLAQLEQGQSAGPDTAVLRRADAADQRSAVAAVEARFRKLLAESEQRQRTQMALQVGQVWKDFNATRANDFVRVQETLDRAQGLTNYQLRQHRDSIQSLYHVSLQK